MPRYTKPRKTWAYTQEFKAKAVQLSLLSDVSVQDIANTLGLHPAMLSRWRKEYREGKITVGKRKKVNIAKEAKELSQLKQLERENARLKEENDLLKKWQQYLAEQHQHDLDSSKNTDES